MAWSNEPNVFPVRQKLLLTRSKPSSYDRQVEKAHRWIQHFCKNYRDESVIEVTGGFGGPGTGRMIDTYLKKMKKPDLDDWMPTGSGR
jgi:hypothetical protein